MSGLAWMMQSRGAIVSGSDRAPSMLTDKLSNSGITVGFEHNAGNAAAAAVLAYQLGCDDWHKIADALSRSSGRVVLYRYSGLMNAVR